MTPAETMFWGVSQVRGWYCTVTVLPSNIVFLFKSPVKKPKKSHFSPKSLKMTLLLPISSATVKLISVFEEWWIQKSSDWSIRFKKNTSIQGCIYSLSLTHIKEKCHSMISESVLNTTHTTSICLQEKDYWPACNFEATYQRNLGLDFPPVLIMCTEDFMNLPDVAALLKSKRH